jgi:hypothetical protein
VSLSSAEKAGDAASTRTAGSERNLGISQNPGIA